MSTRPHRASALVDYIEANIRMGHFPGGSKLPSMADFAEQFSLTRGSVRLAIDYIASLGLIDKRHGSGVYVRRSIAADQFGATGRRVAVFMKRDNYVTGGIYGDAFLGIQRVAEAEKVTLLVNFDMSDDASRMNAIIDQAEGVILLGADEYSDAYKGLSLRAPIVAVSSHDNNGGRMSVVDIDPFLTAQQAANYFLSKQVASVTVVSAPGATYQNRARIFMTHWREAGMEAELVTAPQEVVFRQDTKGYLFTSDSALQDYSLLTQRTTGQILSEQAIILGIDGKSLIDPTFHKMPTIAIDWKLLGECALEECLRRVCNNGRKAQRIYLPGTPYGWEGEPRRGNSLAAPYERSAT